MRTSLLALALWLIPSGAWAQELTGVALGPDAAPLADVPVVLHQVGGGGGAFVSTDTTDGEGGFRFALEGDGGEIYFAALRYDGAMYIGPAVEAGGDPVSGYVLRVEPGSEAGAVASALSSQGPVPTAGGRAQRGRTRAADLGAIVLVAILAIGAAAAFMIAAPRYRRHRTREALVRLATAENALDDPDDVADRARLEATRERLRKQLAPRS